MDIKGYWQKTLIQAQNALTVFPLKAKVAPFNGINTLFPFIENPTPLQQRCWIWISASKDRSYLFWKM